MKAQQLFLGIHAAVTILVLATEALDRQWAIVVLVGAALVYDAWKALQLAGAWSNRKVTKGEGE